MAGYPGTWVLWHTPRPASRPPCKTRLVMGSWMRYCPIVLVQDDKTAFLAQSRTRPKQTSTSGPGQPLGRHLVRLTSANHHRQRRPSSTTATTKPTSSRLLVLLLRLPQHTFIAHSFTTRLQDEPTTPACVLILPTSNFRPFMHSRNSFFLVRSVLRDSLPTNLRQHLRLRAWASRPSHTPSEWTPTPTRSLMTSNKMTPTRSRPSL